MCSTLLRIFAKAKYTVSHLMTSREHTLFIKEEGILTYSNMNRSAETTVFQAKEEQS